MRATLTLLKGQVAGLATSQQCRRALPLSLRAVIAPSTPVFQPYNDTREDRYPAIFEQLASARETLSILSFGCSTGQELTSLRRYFPLANVVGLDASRANVADARRRTAEDPLIEVRRSLSTVDETTGSYDLIFAMAVFRHGALGDSRPASCTPFLDFAHFDGAVADMVRCLRPRGRLVVEHSNFRVRDASSASRLTCVLSRPATDDDARKSPQYGRDNRLVRITGSRRDIAFAKSHTLSEVPGP